MYVHNCFEIENKDKTNMQICIKLAQKNEIVWEIKNFCIFRKTNPLTFFLCYI